MEEHTLRLLEFDRVRETLAAFASTEAGREACRSLQVAGSAGEAERALSETAQFLLFLAEGNRLPLGQQGDVVAALQACETYTRPLEGEELRQVSSLLRSAEALREALSALPPEEYPHLRARAAGVRLAPALAEHIEECIDARGQVVDWASEKLRGARDSARELREQIRERIQALARKPAVARLLQEEAWSVRNDRFVLAVKRSFRDKVRGVLHGYSQTGGTAYIEPQEVVVTGNELAAAQQAARREESRILLQLTKEVLHHKEEVLRAHRLLAWADLTRAKCALVKVYRFSVPQIARDGVLRLHRARHPLLLWYRAGEKLTCPDLEQLFREVVPFDLELGRDFRMLIVTGPNTGGKTVALKAIGLIAVMAACGVPIPAAAPSCVPFYENIFVDIGDEQSLQQSLSTFSSHMTQIVHAVKCCRAGDLVLLDELGAGTDPLEGAALGTVLLDTLRERNCHVCISTHLGSLKEYAYLHREAANAAMSFDPATLAPTYRMLIGAPGKSCALLVAERLGLPEELLAKAQELLRSPQPQELLMERMEKARRAVEAEKRRVQRLRRNAEKLTRKLRRELSEVRGQRRVLAQEAEHEIERKVREVRDALKGILSHFKNVPLRLRPHVERLRELADTVLTVTPLGRRRESFARSLREHSLVYVPRLGAVCTVVRVNKARRRLTVRTEGVEAEVSFDDISWVEPEKGQAPRQ